LIPGIEHAWRDGLKPDPLLTVSLTGRPLPIACIKQILSE
jgi:hypothetical protein